ncbi:MAG: GAF domain-containing protein [Prochlorothrix sp.]
MILDLDQPLFIPEEQVPSGPHAGEWLQWQKHPLKIPGKQEPGVLAIGVNITQHKRTEAWQNSKRLALEAIATAAPLGHILALLVNAMEQQCAGVYGAVYVLDSQLQHLRCEVAPHLPPAYLKAVDPLPLDRNIAQESLNRPLHFPQEQIPFLAKTTASPWQKYEDEALAHGFHPCALIPITSSQNSLLGVFGFYTTPNPIIPTLQDWEIFYTVTPD